MKKKLLIIIFSIIYLLIVGLGFSFLNIYLDNSNVISENITLIDVPSIETGISNEDIINNYINRYNNNDVVGEIKIVNTNYKKAIMQTDNNDYYLNHLEDGTNNYLGSIYLDFRVNIDNDDKLLIFGHNSNTIDMPFKILENYYSEGYYKAHKFIQITTKNKIRLYEIYSVFVETNDFSYMKTDFVNDEDWFSHIKSFKEKSMYDTNVEISVDDDILILQTCSTHSDYRMYDKKYLLIVGKEKKK